MEESKDASNSKKKDEKETNEKEEKQEDKEEANQKENSAADLWGTTKGRSEVETYNLDAEA